MDGTRAQNGYALPLVPNFKSNAGLVLRAKWPVDHAWRTACIHSLSVELVAHPLTSLQDVHLLPEIMNKYLRIVGMRRNPHYSCDHHFFRIFRQDFFDVAGRGSRYRLERQTVHGEKL